MQRPKQQALAFLLGAALVGGVVGFASDRVLRKEDPSLEGRRVKMYDDLGLTPVQRAALDSVFDESNCQIDALYKPLQSAFDSLKPAYDSLKAARRLQMNAILTPQQRIQLDARRKDDDTRREADRKRMKATCRK